jgi:hypothetical protein
MQELAYMRGAYTLQQHDQAVSDSLKPIHNRLDHGSKHPTGQYLEESIKISRACPFSNVSNFLYFVDSLI